MELIERAADAELLGRVAGTASPEVFAEIVRRHVDLVYSTSLRRVRDTHLAEDVTQAVFLVLSQKAAGLGSNVILAGWLYQTARFISADVMKKEQRRREHEAAAGTLPRDEQSAGEIWARISPLLEAAVDRLQTGERDLILLRYFKGMDVADAARMVGIAPNTASKRIGRAIEKLRRYFSERGIQTPGDILGGVIIGRAIHSAPLGLAAQVMAPSAAASALAQGATSAMSASVKLIAAMSVAVITLIVGAAVAIVLTHQTQGQFASAPPEAPPASRPVLAGALEPTSAVQERQIRLAVYMLRHYQVGTFNDPWIKSIETLAAIGRPAVPELVAELKRTKRDDTLRAIAFTLRAIGDPRACPTLIDAITIPIPAPNSDLAIDPTCIVDLDCFKFMRQNELEQLPSANISYGRSIREINAALAKITGHSIKLGSPAQLSRDWKSWWNSHHQELVADEEMASLTAHPHDEAEVERVGGEAKPAMGH